MFFIICLKGHWDCKWFRLKSAIFSWNWFHTMAIESTLMWTASNVPNTVQSKTVIKLNKCPKVPISDDKCELLGVCFEIIGQNESCCNESNHINASCIHKYHFERKCYNVCAWQSYLANKNISPKHMMYSNIHIWLSEVLSVTPVLMHWSYHCLD